MFHGEGREQAIPNGESKDSSGRRKTHKKVSKKLICLAFPLFVIQCARKLSKAFHLFFSRVLIKIYLEKLFPAFLLFMITRWLIFGGWSGRRKKIKTLDWKMENRFSDNRTTEILCFCLLICQQEQIRLIADFLRKRTIFSFINAKCRINQRWFSILIFLSSFEIGKLCNSMKKYRLVIFKVIKRRVTWKWRIFWWDSRCLADAWVAWRVVCISCEDWIGEERKITWMRGRNSRFMEI